jgi:hypothetical protein
MERQSSPFRKSFMPLVLWRNDLEEIVLILSAGGGKVGIVTSEYSFENVAELVAHFGANQSLTNLEITGQEPYTTIDLSRMDARLHVNYAGGNIFLDLSRLLASRQRRWPVLYFFPLLIAIMLVPLLPRLLLSPLPDFLKSAPVSSMTVSPADVFSLALFAWLLWVNFVRLSRHSVIRLQRHWRECHSFNARRIN